MMINPSMPTFIIHYLIHHYVGGEQELEQRAEELVDVLGCYFPIVYTPPADATGKITREELVAGVETALSAAPAFAPYVLPMLLEKLSSSLRCSSFPAV